MYIVQCYHYLQNVYVSELYPVKPNQIQGKNRWKLSFKHKSGKDMLPKELSYWGAGVLLKEGTEKKSTYRQRWES